MLEDDLPIFPESDQNGAGLFALLDRGFGNLLKDIYGGIDSFSIDRLDKLQEPDRYPEFNLEFLKTPLATSNTNHPSLDILPDQFSLNQFRSPMTKIRVDPPVLQNCSQNIHNSATTLNSIGMNLNSCGSGAPSYDGQFGPKVRAIAAESSSQANQLSGVLNNLSGWLGTKARQFLDVDNSSASSTASNFNQLAWITAINVGFPSLANIPFWLFLARLFLKGYNFWNPGTGNLTVPDKSLTRTTIYSATTTYNLRIRAGAGLQNTVLGSLIKGTKLEVLSDEVSRDGYIWVKIRTSDGRVGWVAKEYLAIGKDDARLSCNSKKLDTLNPANSSASANLTFISQNNPSGPTSVLDVKRWVSEKSHSESVSWWKNKTITDVRSHIQAYGCMMTSLTMIMNDKGSTVTVADLYKANYEAKTGGNFDIDVANSGDNHIVVGNIYAEYDKEGNVVMVNKADQIFLGKSGSFTTGAEIQTSLDDAIANKGGAIVIETSGSASKHWVAINKNSDGSYTIRDPLKGQEDVYSNFSELKKKYTITGLYKYVEEAK